LLIPGWRPLRSVRGFSPLSEREREGLAATDRGAGVPDIARTLFLSEGTVRNHLSAAIQKVGARNRGEADQNRRPEGLALTVTAVMARSCPAGLVKRFAPLTYQPH
jgi:DNA-binding NarL/FixJ family response regulator